MFLLRLGLLAPYRESELDEVDSVQVDNMMLVQACIAQYEAALIEVKSGMGANPNPPNDGRRQPPPNALRVGRQRAGQQR